MNGGAERYLVIAGSTAAGKSDLALEMAERIDGEIVVADSRQVYRQLDIGTAKPTPEERTRVRHHLVDRVDVGETYSAGDFMRDARVAIGEISDRGRVPIVCGGTGFYLAALAGGLDPLESEIDRLRRDAARERVSKIPTPDRHAALATIDPPMAARLHPNDRQRVERALEVYFATGRPLSLQQTGGSPERPHVAVQVVRPIDELEARIERRLEEMLERGLEEEARDLWEAGHTRDTPGVDTIGYQEWWPYFEGRTPREVVVATIARATRRYAKRQRTWFRNQGGYRPIEASAGVDAIVSAWESGR